MWTVTDDVAPTEVMAQLTEHGALLMRRPGGVDAEEFVALGDALMTARQYGTSIPDERELVDPTTTTVTAGTNGIPLHREASYAPFSPALLMFHCVRPAAEGGQTTLCDGVALLASFPPRLRAFLADAAIRWEMDLRDGQWQNRCGTEDPDAALAAIEESSQHLMPWETISGSFEGGTMTLTFGTRCVLPALFDGTPTFCNSVLIKSAKPGENTYVDDRLRLLLEDGTPFPAEVLDRIAANAAELTEDVPWTAGDVVIVNNTRYMHGRRAFADASRRIHVRMGYLSPESMARWGRQPSSRNWS